MLVSAAALILSHPSDDSTEHANIDTRFFQATTPYYSGASSARNQECKPGTYRILTCSRLSASTAWWSAVKPAVSCLSARPAGHMFRSRLTPRAAANGRAPRTNCRGVRQEELDAVCRPGCFARARAHQGRDTSLLRREVKRRGGLAHSVWQQQTLSAGPVASQAKAHRAIREAGSLCAGG